MSQGMFFLSTAAQAGAQIMQGQAGQQASKADAEGLKLQAQAAGEQAQDRVDQINRSLASTISNQRAIFASRGVPVGSAVARGLAEASRSGAARDVASTNLSAARQREQLLRQAAARRDEGRSQSLLGFLGGARSSGGRIFNYSRLGGS